MSERMIKIARDRVGSAPGGYVWDKPHAVVPVPEELAQELLEIGAGFYEYFDEIGAEDFGNDFESMTKNQLVAMAKDLGIDTNNKTKAQLIEALNEDSSEPEE